MKEDAVALYIKIDRNTCVHHSKVLLSDIAKIECEREDILRKVKFLVVYNFDTPLKGRDFHNTISMSILRIIQLIHEVNSQILVVNEGESDFIIEYQKLPKKNEWIDKVKTVVLCIIIFFGSAFSIMAFNNDISITDIFDQFYLQATGKNATGINELEVCYCIGLAVGITVFFNHIGSKKITHDPTPIQVEMRKYENDIDMTFIENASRKDHNIDVD